MSPSHKSIKFRHVQTEAPSPHMFIRERSTSPENLNMLLEINGFVQDGEIKIYWTSPNLEDYQKLKSLLGSRPYFHDSGFLSYSNKYALSLHTSDRLVARHFIHTILNNFHGFDRVVRRLRYQGFELAPRLKNDNELPVWLEANNLESWQAGDFTLRRTSDSQKIESIAVHRSCYSDDVQITILIKNDDEDAFNEIIESADKNLFYPWFRRDYSPHNAASLNQFDHLINQLPGFDPSLTDEHLNKLLDAFYRIKDREQTRMYVGGAPDNPVRFTNYNATLQTKDGYSDTFKIDEDSVAARGGNKMIL